MKVQCRYHQSESTYCLSPTTGQTQSYNFNLDLNAILPRFLRSNPPSAKSKLLIAIASSQLNLSGPLYPIRRCCYFLGYPFPPYLAYDGLFYKHNQTYYLEWSHHEI